MADATQQGADDIKPSHNPRNDVIAQMAKQVYDEEHAPNLQAFDEDTGKVFEKGKAEDKPETDGEREDREARERDEKGRFVAKDAPEPAQAAEEPNVLAEDPAPQETKQEQERRFKIKVYGQEQEIPESELIQGYQISAAARRQLEAANAAKKQYEEALARIGQTTRPEAGNELQPEGRSPAIPPVEVISAIVRHEVEQNEAVAAFKREFPDIAGDPVLYREAIAREDQRLFRVQQNIEPPRPLSEALREHGEAIRKWKAGIATPTLTNKQERKASITNVPAASVRAPAPVAEKPKTLDDTIAEMRRKRGFKS